GDTDGTAATHFADDADDAFAGRGRHLVAQLGTLALQQLVHRLLLGWTVENDRRAFEAVPVVEHFPVAQVAGDADQALAFAQRLLDQRDGLLRTPHPGAGAFREAAADIDQGLADQLLPLGR